MQLKKVLSSIPEAPLNVECLMNDIDFRSYMTREKFEELAAPVLARAHGPLKQVSQRHKRLLRPNTASACVNACACVWRVCQAHLCQPSNGCA